MSLPVFNLLLKQECYETRQRDASINRHMPDGSQKIGWQGNCDVPLIHTVLASTFSVYHGNGDSGIGCRTAQVPMNILAVRIVRGGLRDPRTGPGCLYHCRAKSN
ncbi:MAG: hypothetical protein ACRDFX_05445 [Chloroflexota bacterium]